jgi:hypothetical protein
MCVQGLVAEVAALVVRFSTSGAYSANTAILSGDGGALQRLPSLATARLPTALSDRFVACAHLASAGFRRSLFGDDFAVTSAGLMEDYSYGVFDGLAVPSYLLAMSNVPGSPNRSPHKSSSGGVVSPGSGQKSGYAVPSTAAVDEDEF